MDLATATELLSLESERADLARRMIRTAGWVRVADDPIDGTPRYAPVTGEDGMWLSLALMFLCAEAAETKRGAQGQQSSEVSEAGDSHVRTVAPRTGAEESP